MDNNKIALITGCNSGIGKVTAIELAKKDYEILMLVRESEKSQKAFEEIKQASKSNSVKLYFVDLSSLESINKVAMKVRNDYDTIDLLINNAGIFKRGFEKSVDGFELTLAVNYFATFAVTTLLLPLLKQSAQARIINLSSAIYGQSKIKNIKKFSEMGIGGNQAYAISKLLVIYFTKLLSKQLETNNIMVNCLHPGVVGTDVFREYPKWFNSILNRFITNPSEGAKPTIFLATDDELIGVTGKYFDKMKLTETNELANNMELAQWVWNKTEDLISKKITLE